MKKDKTVLCPSRSLLMDIICMCVDVYIKAESYTSLFWKHQWTQKQKALIFDLGLLKQKETPFPASLTVKEHPTSQLPCLYISAAFISCEKKEVSSLILHYRFPVFYPFGKNNQQQAHAQSQQQKPLRLVEDWCLTSFRSTQFTPGGCFQIFDHFALGAQKICKFGLEKSQDIWPMWILFRKSHLCHLWMVVETTVFAKLPESTGVLFIKQNAKKQEPYRSEWVWCLKFQAGTHGSKRLQ